MDEVINKIQLRIDLYELEKGAYELNQKNKSLALNETWDQIFTELTDFYYLNYTNLNQSQRDNLAQNMDKMSIAFQIGDLD